MINITIPLITILFFSACGNRTSISDVKNGSGTCIVMYEHERYNTKRKGLSWKKCLNDNKSFNYSWNDKISSFKLGWKVKVRFCHDRKKEKDGRIVGHGKCSTHKKGLGWVGKEHNDHYSWFQLMPK